MRRTFKFLVIKQSKFLLFALIIIIAGCSLEKESGFNRTMQNLTAHYNILFNANEILRQKQISYATSFIDNYNEILSVYQDTTAQSTTPDKDLELAITKGNNIINVKEQSHYIGDAYLVLGKANYLEGNFYNAAEYFGYVIRSFPKRKDLTQDALVWQARTLMYLDKLPQAKLSIDTAILNINPKKRIHADIYATKLQYDINVQDYADAEEMGKLAVRYCHDKDQRLRWTFILAQVQELNNKRADAIKNYRQIAKSNALFEMAFNASLNVIRIEDNENGVKINRIDKLLGLLKNPNNKEFKDQIYYQAGQLELADKHIDPAIKYYNHSVRSSVKNQSQKGLSYLRLAEIYFNNKADYLDSKKYYDSTLTSLPTNFPGYQAIRKKGANLQLLADRLQIITREDTLQALAKMDEKTRAALIDKMVSDRILQQQQAANASKINAAASNSQPGGGNSFSGGAFYFDNANAVSQGYTDFKKKWGNRKLEDDWRRSSRSASNITSNSAASTQGADPDGPANQAQNTKTITTAASYRKDLLDGIPLTAEQLAQSNSRLYNAYVDIGNFYRDILDDKKEAVNIFELLLRRFPEDPNKPAIYYNLYRLYTDLDPKKSEFYKDKLIKEFPETPFAKIIIDPDFAKKLDDKDAEFTQAYNVIFDLFANKQYEDVIDCVPELLKKYPNNKLNAQLTYLQTMAQGHFEKVTPLRDTLQQIVKRFPLDRLVTPLVKQQLAYIDANQAELATRQAALANDDPHDIPFTLTASLKEQSAYRRPARLGSLFPSESGAKKPPVKTAANANQTAKVTPPPNTTPPGGLDIDKPLMPASIFSLSDSTNYYFVVNVSSGTTNLASSRFGIGQFDRANYAGKGIKHLVLPIEAENQLIYVGRFASLEEAKGYARQIIPVLPDIMKVPKDKYTFFIITKENLDKLADKKKLDSYIDYYQKKVLKNGRKTFATRY